jgi:hypothetical protein
VALGASALFSLYALSLGVLALFQLGEGGEAAYESAHVVVSALWAAAGLVAVVLGTARPVVRAAAFAWLGITFVKTIAFDWTQLGGDKRSYAFLAVAGGLFLAGYVAERLGPRSRREAFVTAVFAVAALWPLTLTAVATLVDGRLWSVDLHGLVLLGVAALYGSFAATLLFRRRNYATLLWALAFLVAAIAEGRLVSGQWLAGIWAASVAVLAWLALRTGERRFGIAALAYLGCALGYVLAFTAPPSDFFTAGEDPGAGVPSVFLVALASLAVAYTARRGSREPDDGVDTWLDAVVDRLRTVFLWAGGSIALYALSLLILELFELARPGSVESSFQSGHTAVSATWGVLGLLLLYAGLKRRMRSLRLGGFALFGLSLAKLFLYDLAQLSSVTRALSFLAVGAVLLLGGFLYQRLRTA